MQPLDELATQAQTIEDAIYELSNLWRSTGIQEGDLLLVHSSASRTLRRYKACGIPLTPNHLLKSFQAAIGKSGTLLLPTWNYDFPKGIPFDIRNSPSQVGALTETGRLHPDAVRTGHPVHPLVAIGPMAKIFQNMCNYTAYGKDSPFAIIHKENAKIAVLDVSEDDSMTFYHHVEEMHEVNYRFHKKISGLYTDFSGNQSQKEFDLFVRYIEKDFEIEVNLDPMGEIMWKKNLYCGERPKVKSGLRYAYAKDLYSETALAISQCNAEGILYKIRGIRPSFLT